MYLHIKRAVMESKAHLEAAGHKLVPFHPPNIPQMMRLFVRSVSVDGGKFLFGKITRVRLRISNITEKHVPFLWLVKYLW